MTPSFRFASDDAPDHRLHLEAVPRPPGARVQWLSFGLRLHDFVAHTPASHFAVVLRAALGYDAGGRACSISGRGMTLGDTSLAQPVPGDPHAAREGFGGARGAQIETFWPGGNFLHAASAVLDDGLRDGLWYGVDLRVDDAARIAFSIAREDGPPVRAEVLDPVQAPVTAGATGVLIGIGRGPGERGPWSAELRGIATGWY